MGNLSQIKQLKLRQKAISELVDNAYTALANTTQLNYNYFSLDGVDLLVKKIIQKTFSSVNLELSKIQKLDHDFKLKPTNKKASELMFFAKKLLAKRMNHEAVIVLKSLYKHQFKETFIVLGEVFMYGVKNRLGHVEFKHPQNAKRCLQKGLSCGNIESGYLLGVLYRTYGQIEKAQQVFESNSKLGCIKSTTEVIILLQAEVSKSQDLKHSAILKQKIKNLRSDLTYISN